MLKSALDASTITADTVNVDPLKKLELHRHGGIGAERAAGLLELDLGGLAYPHSGFDPRPILRLGLFDVFGWLDGCSRVRGDQTFNCRVVTNLAGGMLMLTKNCPPVCNEY